MKAFVMVRNSDNVVLEVKKTPSNPDPVNCTEYNEEYPGHDWARHEVIREGVDQYAITSTVIVTPKQQQWNSDIDTLIDASGDLAALKTNLKTLLKQIRL